MLTDKVLNQFFAPVQVDVIDKLLSQYEYEKSNILKISDLILNTEGLQSVFSYFVKGNVENNSRISLSTSLFKTENALKILNATYWQEVLKITSVDKYMPNKRRLEWNKDIEEGNTPEFNDSNVRATVISLLNSRKKFISEKVDGIFQNLSGEHVTNRPEGFTKKMIIARIMDKNELLNHDKIGYIDDLMSVLNKIIKGSEDSIFSSYNFLKNIIKTESFGQWFELNGGSLKIKLFKVGTVHVELHPDLALSLNEILSYLYPLAIPEKYKQRKKNEPTKEFELKDNLISNKVLNILDDLKTPPLINKRHFSEGWTNNKNSLYVSRYSSYDKDTVKEFETLMNSIGGERKQKNQAIWFEFSYPVKDIITFLLLKGEYPDFKSYQYYPTDNYELKDYLMTMADIQDTDSCLEPSAGQGAIAEKLNILKTTCIEISEVNAKILKSKGFEVYNEDFIKWSKSHQDKKFDKVVMNPPFSKNRALLHVKTAFSHVKKNGLLCAIIPSTYKDKIICEGYKHEYSQEFNGFFEGTNVSIVILSIYKN